MKVKIQLLKKLHRRKQKFCQMRRRRMIRKVVHRHQAKRFLTLIEVDLFSAFHVFLLDTRMNGKTEEERKQINRS